MGLCVLIRPSAGWSAFFVTMEHQLERTNLVTSSQKKNFTRDRGIPPGGGSETESGRMRVF